jgi:hypothetical protein
MTVAPSPVSFATTTSPVIAAHAEQPAVHTPVERSTPSGCSSFDAKACRAAAVRVVLQASARMGSAPADTPTALRSIAALAGNGALHLATPRSVKSGPDGIAVRPNERFISVQGTVNGAAGTLLTAVAERDNASAPWRMTYTIGAGAVQLRIQQQPIAGQPGRFNTTIGPLDPAFDFGGFGAPVKLTNTGPLVVQAAKDGGLVTATIDGKVVFPTSRSDLIR